MGKWTQSEVGAMQDLRQIATKAMGGEWYVQIRTGFPATGIDIDNVMTITLS